MKKRIVSSACAAAVLSLAIAMAQATDTQGTGRTPPETRTQEIMITGCIARMTGANPPGQFVLNNALMSPKTAASVGTAVPEAIIAGGVTRSTSTENPQAGITQNPEPGAVGTSGREPNDQTRRPGQAGQARRNGPADTPSSYVLIAGRNDLSMWVGQRVEVTGTIVSSAGGSSANDTRHRGTGTTGTTGSTPSATVMPRLQVQSVKAVQGNCI
jgi:hypothetical protein